MKNADNIGKAIEHLNKFTKNWCMNCAETEEKNDLIFRCDECEFCEGNLCLVKKFAHNHESNYDMNNFGCMGR